MVVGVFFRTLFAFVVLVVVICIVARIVVSSVARPWGRRGGGGVRGACGAHVVVETFWLSDVIEKNCMYV